MSNVEAIFAILSDRRAHSSFEIVREVYKQNAPTIARLAARIYDIKKRFGVEVLSWKDHTNPKMTWYMIPKDVVDVAPARSEPVQSALFARPLRINLIGH